MLILGIDDAGRGPLIGPMILAGVLVTKSQETIFKKYRIRDSKKFLFNSHRIKLSTLIKQNSLALRIVKTFPNEIDHALINSINLNMIEAIKTAQIINEINKGKFQKQKIQVIVDCPSNNAFAWRTVLLEKIHFKKNLEVHCEHKADENHLAVSAASILAKVTREEEISKLKKQYGEIGSGYAADPITQEFLKTRGKKLKDSGIFRQTWSTWKKLYPEKKQTTLDGF